MDSTNLARILSDPDCTVRTEIAEETQGELRQLAEAHGVQALTFATLGKNRSPGASSAADQLRPAAFHQGVLFRLQDRELERMCSALCENALPYVLIKGAALAYQIYPTPDMRPRSDTDLFISETHLLEVKAVLSSLGYLPITAHDGGLVSYQTGMTYMDEGKVSHTVDIHWNLSNRHQYRGVLDFDFIHRSAVPLARFDMPVLAPDHVQALCVACLHLVGHHADSPRLIWLYDMRLLLQRLRDEQIDEFVGLTRSLGLEKVCSQALTELRRHFDDAATPRILSALGHPEGLPMPADSRLSVFLSNLRAFPTLFSKCRYMLALAFPAPHYIEEHYQLGSKLLIPWFYLYRIYKGSVNLFVDKARGKEPR